MSEVKNPQKTNEPEEKQESFLKVIVHSFFIIPFLIAVFCLLLFAGVHLLTSENKDAFDYIEDVKVGGKTKRWQAAFELSKILANPDQIPDEERFQNELINAFIEADHDDPRVQQYLALAMGRTQNTIYLEPLLSKLTTIKEQNLPAVIYALGMLRSPEVIEELGEFIDHPDERIRSMTAVALGNIGDQQAVTFLKKGLMDAEPNVKWGSAISLALLKDDSGKEIISQLLNEKYYEQFTNVDQTEKINLMIAAIDASRYISDIQITKQIIELANTAENMKVRSAAMKVTKNTNE